MQAVVRERITSVDQIVTAADHYADEFVAALPRIESDDELRAVTAGMLINFLTDVLNAVPVDV